MSINDLQRLQTRYDISRALHEQALDHGAILQTALSLTGQAVGAEHGCILTLDDKSEIRDAYMLGITGDPTAEVGLWERLFDRGLLGFVHHGKRTIHIRNLNTDPRWPALPPNPVFPASGSAIGLSLKQHGTLYGIMLLLHEQVDFFDQDIIDMLEDIAHMTALALAKVSQTESQKPAPGLEQLRSDLSVMVYHDLRGPLHNISSSLSSLGRILANHEQQAVLDLIQVGTRSARQLSRLVDSLLNIQQLEDGQAILDRQQISLHRLLADAADLVQPLVMEAQQRLSFAIADDLPPVAIDGDMILRVAINLLENAIKYTPDGGVITLGAALVHDHIRISVTDTGPGIPAHMKDLIFEKFSRVKSNGVVKGVGLGLAFCRLAVEAHGGCIWVESEPGQGSAFHFTLPVEQVLEKPLV